MKCTFKRLALLAATMVSAAALLSGCGSDGSNGANGLNGADGINGTNGTNGTNAAVKPAETCTVCHADGKNTGHASSSNGDLDVTITASGPSTTTPADLVVTFNVKVNGANKSAYYDAYGGDGYRLRGDTLFREAVAGITLVNNGSGNYTATIPNGVTTNAGVNSRYLFYVKNTTDAALASASRPAGYRAYITFDYPAAPITELLGSSSTSCEGCHGGFGNGFHRGAPAFGGKTCTVCHDAANTTYPLTAPMIHGIHNSANMPTGKFTLKNRAATPKTWDYSIAFPSYMDNCSICHQTGAPLTAAISKPVDYNFCMTCHQNWDGFTSPSMPAGHKNYTAATNCSACHNADPSIATVGGMHNAAELSTGNGGLLYDGVDVGLVEGAKIGRAHV